MTIQFCRGPAEVTLNIEYSLLTLLAIAQRLEITLICRRKAEQMSVNEWHAFLSWFVPFTSFFPFKCTWYCSRNIELPRYGKTSTKLTVRCYQSSETLYKPPDELSSSIAALECQGTANDSWNARVRRIREQKCRRSAKLVLIRRRAAFTIPQLLFAL